MPKPLTDSQFNFLLALKTGQQRVSHSYRNRTAFSLYIRDLVFYSLDQWHLTEEGIAELNKGRPAGD